MSCFQSKVEVQYVQLGKTDFNLDQRLNGCVWIILDSFTEEDPTCYIINNRVVLMILK